MFTTPKQAAYRKVSVASDPSSPSSSSALAAASEASLPSTLITAAAKLYSEQQPSRSSDKQSQQLPRRSGREKGKKVAFSLSQAPPRPAKTTQNSPSASASDAEDIVAKPAHRYRLRIAIDYGTFNLNAMYQLKDTQDAVEYPIRAVYFRPRETNSPMWLHVTQLQWGHSVKEAFEAKKLALERIICLPKLAIHLDADNLPGLRLLKDQIKHLGHGFDNIAKLIQTHLQGIVNFIFDQFSGETDGMILSATNVDLAAIDKEIHLAVPQAWDPTSNEVMSTAAMDLGYEGQLVVEPQCVAAFAIHFESLRASARQLRQLVGDNVRQMVVDAGGGTVDLIKFEMSTSKGAKAKMKTIGNPRGELIGSALINDDLVDLVFDGQAELPDGYGLDLDGFLRYLGMDCDTLRAQLYQKFEYLKVNVATIGEVEPMRVHGTKASRFIEVPQSLIRRCVDRGIQKVINMVAGLIDDRTKVLILSGGFGTSPLLKAALKDRWPGCHLLEAELDLGQASLPVAHGALLRHEKVALGTLPSGFSYFWTQDYPYNESVHLDAAKDDSLIRKSKWKKTDSMVRIVNERITNLLKEKDIPDGQHVAKAISFSYFWMYEDGLKISADIYWAKENLEQEKALQDYRSIEDDPINPDYRLWKKIEVDVPKKLIDEAGYKLKKTSDGRNAFEIAGRIILEAKEAVMTVVLQIARNGQEAAAKRCGPKSKSKALLKLATVTVWNSTFSHTTAGDVWANPAMATVAADGDEESAAVAADGDEDSATEGSIMQDDEPVNAFIAAHPREIDESDDVYQSRLGDLHNKFENNNEDNALGLDPKNMSPKERLEQVRVLQDYENVNQTRDEMNNPELLAKARGQRAAQRGGDVSELVLGDPDIQEEAYSEEEEAKSGEDEEDKEEEKEEAKAKAEEEAKAEAKAGAKAREEEEEEEETDSDDDSSDDSSDEDED